MPKSNQTSADVSCEGNALGFALRNLIGGYSFIDIVRVEEVTGNTLTVKPLLSALTMDDEAMERGVIYDVPYLQLRRGGSAVIMDPVVGDLGLIAVCDKDITNIKRTKTESVPDNFRAHSCSDAVYLTGIASLNSDPTQYIHFHDGGIDIFSPFDVNVNGKVVTVNAREKISLNCPQIELNGNLVQGEGEFGGSALFANGAITPEDFKAGDISLKNHRTPNIQRGDDTSNAPIA